MTKKNFDLKMQTLNCEYTTRSNEIARRKDNSAQRKLQAIKEADDAFHAEKRSRLEKISQIRMEKAALFIGDTKRAILEAEARNLEAEISVMRDDNERRKRVISKLAYDERCALDEESRQLSEWYNNEKLKVLKQYTEEQ